MAELWLQSLTDFQPVVVMAEGNAPEVKSDQGRTVPEKHFDSNDTPHVTDATVSAHNEGLHGRPLQDFPMGTQGQHVEGQHMYQYSAGTGIEGPPGNHTNKFIHMQTQIQRPQQQQARHRYYDGVNYLPGMYTDMGNLDVPAFPMIYAGLPNHAMDLRNMGYAMGTTPWNVHKLEMNPPARDRNGWSSRSDSMQSTDTRAFDLAIPKHERKSKSFNSLSNKKGNKFGTGKSATDGMTMLPIKSDLSSSSSSEIFEEALNQSLSMEGSDVLQKLEVSQDSLGNMINLKELSCSDTSGAELCEKFKNLSDEAVVYLSREFSGSKIIQQCLDNYDESFAEMLYNKIKKYQTYLAVDTYGNYVMQNLIKTSSLTIQNDLGLMLEENLLPLSLNFYGCRVVQMAIKHLPAKFSDIFCAKIAPIALQCLQSQHANHVVKAFFLLQGDRAPKDMVNIHEMICKNSEHIATHIYGFKVLQAALGCGLSPDLSKATVLSMEKKVISLSCGEYGNYLIQYFIESDIFNSRDMAISSITNAPVLLMTCHKFGSNVIEKAIVHGSHEQKSLIIQRIIQECSLSGSIETALLHVASNRFGNYVLQRIFEVASLQDRELLTPHLRPHSRALSTSMYGRHLIKYL